MTNHKIEDMIGALMVATCQEYFQYFNQEALKGS